MTFLYKSDPQRGEAWKKLFNAMAPDIDFRIWPDTGDPAFVRFLATWNPPEDVCRTYPRLELLFLTGAGADHVDLDALPDHIPLVRMTEPGLADRLAEYVVHAVLSVHRDALAYEAQQAGAVWKVLPPRLASELRVGIMGMGNMARAALARLIPFGYPCAGWSRSAHQMKGVDCYAGPEGLPRFLARTDVLVCLLPLTDDTRRILNESTLLQLPKGASLVQTGRGGHLDQEALLRLLGSRHLKSAYLDVTDPEPLPPSDPLWRHPAIRITPHVASTTRPDTAVEGIVANIRRHQAGTPLIGVVDRRRKY